MAYGILVLSPMMEPPLRCELGSTASTASRWPRETSSPPKASISVDLPVPGGPEMPIRSDCGGRCGSTADRSWLASFWF